MTKIPSTCPNCNAPLPQHPVLCEYCGTYFEDSINAAHSPNNSADTGVSEDFGIANSKLLFVTVIGAAILYGWGWRLEDLEFLLSEGAVILWGGILPLWLAASAFIWKAQWGQWLPGFAISIPIFLFHILIIWMIDGRVNDDVVGISAAFSAASLLGWVIGRLFHNYIRKARYKNK